MLWLIHYGAYANQIKVINLSILRLNICNTYISTNKRASIIALRNSGPDEYITVRGNKYSTNLTSLDLSGLKLGGIRDEI